MVDVSVIGCGHLGSAVIRGLARTGTHTVTACDLDDDALAAVEPYVAQTTKDLDVAADASVVILGVKPQNVSPVLKELEMNPEQTLLSFAAAVPTDFIEKWMDTNVVRGMPNLAVETGSMACGVTGDVGDDARRVLDDLGKWVEIDEEHMDISTALNGSGPAFIFYLIGMFAAAGVERGIDEADAALLTAQTFKGAAEIVLQSDEEIEDLIEAVTSEGGTTIEGMGVLWDSDVDEVFEETIRVTEERSVEISEEFEDGRDF